MGEVPNPSSAETHKEHGADQCVISITNKLNDLRKPWRPKECCIYKVPDNIHQGDIEAYEPQVISIGPYHRGKPHLKTMESHKLLALEATLSYNKIITLDNLVEEIKKMELEIRSSYSDTIDDLDTDKFAEMIVLDGIFVVDLLQNYCTYSESETAKWMIPLLTNDLLLLENQIPFFALQSLFDLIYPPADRRNTDPHRLMHHAMKFFTHHSKIGHLPFNKKSFPREPCHLLHLVHDKLVQNPSDSRTSFNRSKCSIYLCCGCYSTKTKSTRSGSVKWIPNATKLQEAGIDFKMREGGDLYVNFNNGLMEIPHMFVGDVTNSFFRNQIAWEQCHPGAEFYFTTYVIIMDCLVNTPKDVEILHENGILEHGLGSHEEVALLFNKICKGLFFCFNGHTHLEKLFGLVKDYCDIPCHGWRAKLVHDYFSNPWAIISLAAAVLLLILTFISTFFSMLAYFRPP